jgi:uncharacterized protein (UPF0548 family)
MRSFRRPTPEVIERFLREQAAQPFTYPAVGATASVPPPGYVIDHTRIVLGDGEAVFDAAKAALTRWDQFRLGWLEARPGDAPIAVGQTVAIVARSLGVWWLNACRIVYVVDEERRYGFAYGTLPGHIGQGEERFLVERDADGRVWFEILAFSRPGGVPARLGYPWLRRTQRRFGREAAAAMRRAVAAT